MDADTNASALVSLEDAHDMIQIIDEDGGWVYVEAAPMTISPFSRNNHLPPSQGRIEQQNGQMEL